MHTVLNLVCFVIFSNMSLINCNIKNLYTVKHFHYYLSFCNSVVIIKAIMIIIPYLYIMLPNLLESGGGQGQTKDSKENIVPKSTFVLREISRETY